VSLGWKKRPYRPAERCSGPIWAIARQGSEEKALKNHRISFKVNGKQVSLEVQAHETLISVLRERLGLTGTKEGCGTGQCGACIVLLDGKTVNACLVLGADCSGADITTVEGLDPDARKLHPLQESFMQHGAVQCGFCTPGMLMSAKGLLDHDPNPDRKEIRTALSGNLCRCTGYKKIIDAVEAAAAEQS
jgi:carbon-monoxide dehydrogenase small subunit